MEPINSFAISSIVLSGSGQKKDQSHNKSVIAIATAIMTKF